MSDRNSSALIFVAIQRMFNYSGSLLSAIASDEPAQDASKNTFQYRLGSNQMEKDVACCQQLCNLSVGVDPISNSNSSFNFDPKFHRVAPMENTSEAKKNVS